LKWGCLARLYAYYKVYNMSTIIRWSWARASSPAPRRNTLMQRRGRKVNSRRSEGGSGIFKRRLASLKKTRCALLPPLLRSSNVLNTRARLDTFGSAKQMFSSKLVRSLSWLDLPRGSFYNYCTT
jgi:hypothetical protein